MRSNAMAYPQRLVATTLFAFATLVMAACHGEAPPSSLQPESPTRPPSCANVSCSGNGTCAIANGSPSCSCNSGYRADGLSCVPDASTASASLEVVNNSIYDIYYLYLSPCGSDTWGPDILGNKRLPTGYSATLRNIPCGRCYDLKADTYAHGKSATRYNNYFSCNTTFTWTIN